MRIKRRIKASKIDGRNPTKKRINDDKKRKCGGKRAYSSEAEAAEHALLASMGFSCHITAYKCPYCPYWHYGNTPLGVLIMDYPEVAAQVLAERLEDGH